MHRDKFVATYNMISHRTASIAALLLVLMAGAAAAQDRSSGGFLDNLFKRGEGQAEQPQQAPPPPTTVGQEGPVDSNNVGVRIDRIENSLRQLTGTLEQLQYQNQQLQMQLKRMQDDTEYRLQQLGSKGTVPTAGAAPRAMAPQTPAVPMTAPADAAAPGRRSDAFDPSRQPNAPGAPRTLGNEAVAAPVPDNAANVPPVGAPDGRAPGAPLDLSTLAANPIPQAAPVAAPPGVAGVQPRTAAPAAGVQLATLPPSASPQDEYDMAYGYVLHKDYPLAEQTFRDFLRKYPNERLVPEAQYWLGESLFQGQHYRDAAESFLAVSTKYESSGKAPDALLRLGQSLAALSQREAACATLAEVGRKYPRASASVKRGVTQEQKRAHC
jgi:tol-pal system protein YbgF